MRKSIRPRLHVASRPPPLTPPRKGEGNRKLPGSQPPPDNSFDRRADFANAHRARASVTRGFGEAPQQGYVGKTPVPPGELDPDLARALGIDEQDEHEAEDPRHVITPDMGPAHLRLKRAGRGEVGTVAGLASQQSLDRLLARRPAGIPRRRQRQNLGAASARAAGKERRRPAPGHQVRPSIRRAISRRPSPTWSKACAATIAARCCSASPARARPSPWRR